MAINVTTLTSAIGAADTSITVGSVTGITAPNFTTGVGITYLNIEMEWMLVTGVPSTGTTITVQRGYLGSPAVAHGASAGVLAGLPTDFPAPPIAIKAQQDFLYDLFGVAAPVASTNTTTASGQFFHITGTNAVTTLNPPAGNAMGGPYYVVFDGTATFATGGNIGVAVTGAAGKLVVMVYDQANAKWYSTT